MWVLLGVYQYPKTEGGACAWFFFSCKGFFFLFKLVLAWFWVLGRGFVGNCIFGDGSFLFFHVFVSWILRLEIWVLLGLCQYHEVLFMFDFGSGKWVLLDITFWRWAFFFFFFCEFETLGGIAVGYLLCFGKLAGFLFVIFSFWYMAFSFKFCRIWEWAVDLWWLFMSGMFLV